MEIARSLAGLVVLAGLAAADRESFEADVARVRGMVDRAEWAEAHAALRELVGSLELEDWALARWPELEDYLGLSAFWSHYEVPEPAELVGGELVNWNARTGRIELRYRRGDRGLSPYADGGDFYVTEGDAYLHPMLFKGAYRITLKGERLESALPVVYVAWDWVGTAGDGKSYGILFGEETGVFEYEGSQGRLAEVAKTSLDPKEPYELEVQVASSTLTVVVNGKRVLRMKRDKGEWGQFGLLGFDEIERMDIVGEIEPSWIAGLKDERILADYRAFLAEFDPFEGTPSWLEPSVRGKAKHEPDFGSALPGLSDVRSVEALGKASVHDALGQVEEGLAYARSLKESGQASAVASDWILAHFLVLSGELEEAREACARVKAADPTFFPAWLLAARIARALGSVEDGLRGVEELQRAFPDYVESYSEEARLHLFAGDPERAWAAYERGVRNGIPVEALESLPRTLLSSENGPRFGDASTFESKNYVVTSDLGEKVCYEVATELEKFYLKYVGQIRRPEGVERRKFQVYVFSGRDGYLAYTEDLLGDPAKNTLGLYSPWLKQLVLWNSPDRRLVMRTVRHEGFHQYLDRLTSEAPEWLNEGMAEYYEQARLEQGRWKDDQVNPDHVRLLRGLPTREWTGLRELVFGDRWLFRSRSSLHYAQAWAFVHFLHNSTRDAHKRLNALLDALFDGAERLDALERAFEGVDWGEWEQAYREYVRGL